MKDDASEELNYQLTSQLAETTRCLMDLVDVTKNESAASVTNDCFGNFSFFFQKHFTAPASQLWGFYRFSLTWTEPNHLWVSDKDNKFENETCVDVFCTFLPIFWHFAA